MRQEATIALLGQQNAGKTTLFNALTGARQYVANYPGVTVEKKSGRYSFNGQSTLVVDLPGTYSLTSFSPEERVTQEFLLTQKPQVCVNVVDAANLRRSLNLTMQLLEMGQNVVLALNMLDVATRRGITISVDQLSSRLGIPVVETVGSKGQGCKNLKEEISAVEQLTNSSAYEIDYGPLEGSIKDIEAMLVGTNVSLPASSRWFAIKLLEQDQYATQLITKLCEASVVTELEQKVSEANRCFFDQYGADISDHVINVRNAIIRSIISDALTTKGTGRGSVSKKIDSVVLNRIGAPIFLILTVYLIYQASIVWGYELTNYTWPYLAKTREILSGFLPAAGFIEDPYTRALGLWLIDSANTLLNYVPIFLILFALIAILEDSGYMARIAFILDRILNRFGLHGQSTLPLILGGVFAGGCAVPAIMATKGIPDNRARMATIFAVPFMNCLAKVPLYTLLLGIFFVEDKSLMTFYISTMTVIFALLVSKLLTKTVLKGQETSPFVMELPSYHVPTIGGVLRRSIERTWVYIKKVGTIVVAVAVVVFTLLQFPGLPEDRMQHYEAQAVVALDKFQSKVAGSAYENLASEAEVVGLVNFYNDYRRAKLNAKGAAASRKVAKDFKARNAEFYAVVKPPKGDKDAKAASRALRKLIKERNSLRRDLKEERLSSSLLGAIGRSMEPVTQYAGFDWKINIALLSSFAARESSVATLGVLFQQSDSENASLEERMGDETKAGGATALLAVSMILFFALYPPCLATTVMVRVQTGSYLWMVFSILFPTFLGLTVSSIVFTAGTYFSLTGIEAMSIVYFAALALVIAIGLKSERTNSGTLINNRHSSEVSL
ncbi:ferrous iron transport protein B [Rhodobacteraceae bacterium RKSG542]|uniref:ferrous iron transport protein B n=1 Tax=Pseudovibrio flavus TaxID=2529854 RepID=UPI0012BC0B1D|nr:ferrous iron transport protein B [Pseudovibrio flavus]MTI17473.1 ferrous iron transport protein B [Pseudovibrio flavus]